MLAYVSWHQPAAEVEAEAYEQALERFHRSLAHRPPSGFSGSASFRAHEPPWTTEGAEPPPGDDRRVPGFSAGDRTYEDWYLLDGWSAVGVLEEAAISTGHITAHESIAGLAGAASGAIYRLEEGHAALKRAHASVWIARDPGHRSPTIPDLLGDGMDRETAGLWRRCLGMGPAPEYCLLAPEPSAGVTQGRLPTGWHARVSAREALWIG